MAALMVRMCVHEMTPPVEVRRGRWCSGCRCGVQSAVTAAMAVRVVDSSTMALSAANAATRAWSARLLTARGGSRGWSGERERRRRRRTAVVAAGEGEVVVEVAAGLRVGHRRHRISQPDALVERGEHAELHPPPQGGLADEQARERARRVEIMVMRFLSAQLGQQRVCLIVTGHTGSARCRSLPGVRALERQGRGRSCPLCVPCFFKCCLLFDHRSLRRGWPTALEFNEDPENYIHATG